MSKTTKKRSQKAGLPPGTPVHIGEKKTETPIITMLRFNESTYQEKVAATVAECLESIDENHRTWISVKGLHEIETVQQLATGLGLHPLVLKTSLIPINGQNLRTMTHTYFLC